MVLYYGHISRDSKIVDSRTIDSELVLCLMSSGASRGSTVGTVSIGRETRKGLVGIGDLW